MNLCTYDEIIKTETSFHCMFCGRCVEYFDHHCPFINNCLGYRNHKYFLVFVFSYLVFITLIALETIRHLTETYVPCPDGSSCNGENAMIGGYSIAILVLIGINTPIILY